MSHIKTMFAGVAVAASLAFGSAVFAGDVEIVDASARQAGGKWTFSVTLRHDDEGWDHYADLWEVVGPDGSVLGQRVLAHPHVNEQPFTRSLRGVDIPDGIDEVTIRARDSKHGVSPATFALKLPK